MRRTRRGIPDVTGTAPPALALVLALASLSSSSSLPRPGAEQGGPSGAGRYLAAAFGRAAAEGHGCGLDYRPGLRRMLLDLLSRHADRAEVDRAEAAFEREYDAARRPGCDREGLRDALVRAQDQYNRAAADLETEAARRPAP